MKKKKPTLSDIAKKANVSIGTVDRAIHNRGRISPVVQKKILNIAQEIGYKKNIYASLLASKNKTKHLAYFLPEHGLDDYWDLVLEGVQNAIDNKPIENIKITRITFDLFDANDFLRALSEINKKEIEVLLTAPLFHKEWSLLLQELAILNIPYVIINTFPEVIDANYLCYIGPDSNQSGKLAGRLLHHHCSPGDRVLMMPLEKDYANAQHMIEKKKGFTEFFEMHYPEVEIIISDFENFSSKIETKVYIKKILTKYPNISGIYVSASRIHLLAEALENSEQHPVLIGYDLLSENIAHLKKGNIHYLINQNPKLMGYLGMKTCQEYSIYHTVKKKKILMPMDVILPENLEEAKNGFVSYASDMLSMTI